MIPIAGGIGIGTVWGWLAGGRFILNGKPSRSLPVIILISSVFAGIVYFYEGWMGILVYLISVVVCTSLHYLWQLHLFRKWMPPGGIKELEG